MAVPVGIGPSYYKEEKACAQAGARLLFLLGSAKV